MMDVYDGGLAGTKVKAWEVITRHLYCWIDKFKLEKHKRDLWSA